MIRGEQVDGRLGECGLLARALNTTRDMIELARNDDWESVVECERQRRADLDAFFDAPGRLQKHAELVAEALAVILHLNEELAGLLQVARSAALQAGSEQVRSRRALDSYAALHAPEVNWR
ncbi:MAG: flagellar protein FliT [Parahaliea sp.]